MPVHSLAAHHASELEQLGDLVAELSAHLDAATARLLTLIRHFDARGGWNTGFRSCAAWLSWRVGLDLGAARERVRVARALETLPLLAEALAHGQMSYANVRALTRVATPETEARLLAVGRAGTAAHVERIVRGWRCVDRRAEARETAHRHESRALHAYQDEDGMVVLRGRLGPEVGALLIQALAAARETLYERGRSTDGNVGPVGVSAETSTMAQQRADALALLAESALHHIDPGAPGERYQVVVHVDAQALAEPDQPGQSVLEDGADVSAEMSQRLADAGRVLTESDQPGQSVLEDGARVSAETSRRLACDASRVVMRYDHDGRLLEIGARTRTIPPALRRALHHRDRGCRFPGCGVRFGQGHHLRHWAHGGPTTLSNLALLCRRHHRAVHEEGYQVARAPDRPLRFRRPDGRPLPEVPSPAGVPEKPVEALRAAHESQGLRLTARTARAGWLGERLNVGWAIDVLHPLAQASRPCPLSGSRGAHSSTTAPSAGPPPIRD
jgi:5-methylcytosine-specific restriction endonuclease McrA